MIAGWLAACVGKLALAAVFHGDILLYIRRLLQTFEVSMLASFLLLGRAREC